MILLQSREKMETGKKKNSGEKSIKNPDNIKESGISRLKKFRDLTKSLIIIDVTFFDKLKNDIKII